MIQSLKKFAKAILPYQYHFYFQRRRPAETHADCRHELVQFRVGEQAHLDVYWKDVRAGKGPSLILNILGEEVLRFDFFGGRGHYHAIVLEFQPKSESRLFLPELTVEEQIDRAIFELNRNLDWYLQRHPLAKIRKIKLDKSQLKQATEQAQAQLIAYIGKAEQLEQTLALHSQES